MSISHTKKVLEPVGWILQMLTGLLLLGFVVFHLYITHMISEHALEYNMVIERLSDPAIKAFYWIFLVSASFHGFNGLRAIVLDTNFGGRRERLINNLTMVLFVLAVVYGGVILASL